MPTRFGSTSGRDCRYLPPANDVLVLGVAGRRGVRRRAERTAVADAAPVVDRQHDVALAREPLIDAVGPVVELHVVIAGQHLAHRPAVHEHDRRTLLARLDVLRQEQLVVDLEAVGSLRQHDLRLHVRIGGESRPRRRIDDPLRGLHRTGTRSALHRIELRSTRLAGPGGRLPLELPDAERLRHVPARAERRQHLSGRERRRIRFDAVPARDLARRNATRDRHRPDVATLDVLGVGAVVERLAVRRRARPKSDPRSGRRSS